MTQRKYISCFMILISLLCLLTACGSFQPLLTEDEVLSRLSERYETDFVILDTFNNCEFAKEGTTIRCRLHLAAPAEDSERTFWVHSQLGKYYGGDSLPMRYSRGIEDTFAFDFFLEQFDALLTEHGIDHFFRAGSTKTDISEHLAAQHLQGGGFVIQLSEENAEDVVSTVFTILEQIADEPPLSNYLDHFSHPAYIPIRLVISFSDRNEVLADGEYTSDLPSFIPYDKASDKDGNIIFLDNAESMLEEVYETFYGIPQTKLEALYANLQQNEIHGAE